MASLFRIQSELLADGKITDAEVDRLREFIHENGELDLDDVKLLVNVLSEAREVCPAFDNLFFPLLKEVILQDGRIGLDEQFYLLKMLYSDGQVRDREKQFLRELREEADETSAEFESLYYTALADD
jgi:uncharacterized tellurite resistance protein B-like protein